ncbi:unnamed protein product [Rotaria sp. Silwood2]|nr:unnamed protein product [Rotaria sp. Silwood2]CAF4505505.1 unnamed protein product [Rotaria sp. Silwood2]
MIDNSSTKGNIIDNFSGSIKFEKIVFSYPTRKLITVLNEFDLEIKSGQSIAFVGPSGCGKSTLIQLLERFYDCNQGRILLDDHNIESLNLSWLRSQIGLVNQESVLVCDLTVAENIAYGKASNEIIYEDIIRAAERAHCHDFIKNLPEGYNTPVGHNGTFHLSGGQKQRIAIARALFHNPRILLLDEITSALDADNEQLIQESLSLIRQENPSQTVIFVAHRLSTIQSCDLICLFDSYGHLIESGTHAELMELGNAYYKLFLDYLEGRNNS